MKVFILSIYFLLICCFSLSAQTTVTVKSDQVNIRQNPSTASKSIGKVKKGQNLKVSANQNGWYYVVVGRMSGWIHSSTTVTNYKKEESLPDLFTLENKSNEVSETNYDALAKEYLKWVLYGETEYGKKLYNQSRQIRNGDLLRVWTQTKDLKDSSVINQILVEINCKSEQYREIFQINYFDLEFSNGKYSKRKLLSANSLESSDSKFSFIAPESLYESLLERVCR